MESVSTIWVGLDVHKDTIAACWLRGDSQTEEAREMPNDGRAVRKLLRRLGGEGELRVCYEAGPCGYELRRELERTGIHCEVIAPALIPRRPGDRIKTDHRDARKLARFYRAGELTPIRIPSEAEEAVRDLLRCREDLRHTLIAMRHRLTKFLLRHGRAWRQGRNWTGPYWTWLRNQRFDDPVAQRTLEEYLAQLHFALDRIGSLDAEIARIAEQDPWKPLVDRLRCLRGFDTLAALVLLAEIGDFHRFRSPRQLMSFLGLVPSIHASGNSQRRGSITKSGNTHVRRMLIQSAWQYRHRPQWIGRLRRRSEGQPEVIRNEAFRAQHRLYDRYRRLLRNGKPPQVAIVGVARELCGFLWAIMVKHDAARAAA